MPRGIYERKTQKKEVKVQSNPTLTARAARKVVSLEARVTGPSLEHYISEVRRLYEDQDSNEERAHLLASLYRDLDSVDDGD